MSNIMIFCLVFLFTAALGFVCDDECPLDYPTSNAMGRLADHCYEYVNQTGSWYDAKDDCQSRNGTLTDIHSKVENYALLLFLTKLGLIDGPVWTGLSQANDGVYQWASRADFNYSNWYPGSENIRETLSASSSVCGTMDYDNGQWYITECTSQFVYGWICKYTIY